MATGPIYGRKSSRRMNGSILGSHMHSTWHRKLSNVHRTDGTDGYAPHSGLFDMRQVLSMTMNDGYIPFGQGTSTTSTINHHTYPNVVNYTSEVFGGGGGQGVRDVNSGPSNAYSQYSHGGGNKNQSNANAESSASAMVYFHDGNYNWSKASEYYNGGYGGYGTQGFRDRTSAAANWRYRQIIALTYTGGGYKSGSPWRQVHRSLHSTDQTTNLGTIADHAGSYIAGANNATTFFLWSTPTDNANSTASTRTSAIHMFTDTGKSHNSNYDLYNSRQDLSSSQKELDLAFQTGSGSTNFEVFNLITETKFTQFGGNLTSTGSAFADKDNGYHWDDGTGCKINYYSFSHTSTTHWSAHGQQKGINSKNRIGYCGNEGTYNGGNNYRRWNLTSDTNIGTVGKIEQNMGEENYGQGQDWQYMIGNYDGAQNNENHKLYYATDTGTTVSGLSPTANAGQSSGHCAWRG